MTTLTASLVLDAEQLAALDALIASHAEQTGQTLTREAFAAVVLQGVIADKVALLFTDAVNRIAEAAKSKPYAERMALVQLVESSL